MPNIVKSVGSLYKTLKFNLFILLRLKNQNSNRHYIIFATLIISNHPHQKKNTMKKFYSLIIAISLAFPVFSQTYLSEDFSSGTMPPPGWTIFAFQQQFVNAPSDSAGGVAPECRIDGFAYNGTLRLMSPAMNMTGVNSVTLIFKHNYDKYASPSPTIGVATKSSGAWNPVWTMVPSSDTGPEEIQVTINNSDLNKPNFQISFYVTGTIQNMNHWYFDNILLMVPLELDGKISGITIPGTITSPQEVGGVFQNIGSTAITDFSVGFEAYNGMIYDTSFTGLNLEMFDAFDFTFDQMWVQPFGTHNINMWINNVNGITDDNPGNDTVTKSITYIANILPRKVTFEEFTSSTCGPCASFNSGFVPWCESHPDIMLVKYQMNWPGAGDPYYTAEGGTRRNYYGVSYVPDLFYNGARINASVSAVQTSYNQGLALTSYIDIASSFTITGTTINITTNLLPWDNVGNVRVHNIVIEKVTTGNVSSNGETEFHHVMMDMIPDANGASVNLQYATPVKLQYSVNLAGTNVEEYDDLLVAVLVQNQSTKEMLQSEYGEMNTAYSADARLEMINLDGVPLEGFNPDIYEYDVILPEGTLFEPYLEAVLMDDGAMAVVNPAFELPGTAVVDVYAENRFDTKRYLVHYTVFTGVEDKVVPSIQVYPNPVTNVLHVNGMKDAGVKLFNTSGEQVLTLNKFSGSTIDVSELPSGVYIMNVTTADGQTMRRKIVVY